MIRSALALLLVGAVTTPQPAAMPPPTILRERVGPTCTTLHDLVLPLARLHQQFRAHFARIGAAESQFKKYAGDRIPTNMFAYQIDMEASNLLEKIHQVETLLIKSYAKYPRGKVPKVDALRQHVQNVVDLERAIANKYEFSFGSIIDNANIDVIQQAFSGFGVPAADSEATGTMGGSGGVGTAVAVNPSPWPAMIGAPAANAVALPADDDPRISSTPPPGLRARLLKFYGLAQLGDGLKTEGQALITQSLIAARDCDGV